MLIVSDHCGGGSVPVLCHAGAIGRLVALDQGVQWRAAVRRRWPKGGWTGGLDE
jgi:hypothetical protein